MATVLVSGGSGFIGSWVLRELVIQGHHAVALDVQQTPERLARVLGPRAGSVTWVTSTLEPVPLQQILEHHAVTHVIHLAALLTPACHQDPFLGCQVNVLGSAALFEAARRIGTVQGISYASSFAVYGPETDADGVTNRPTSFYGAFKQAVDLIAEQYWRQYGLRSIAVRPHVVYGPERDQGLTAGPSLAIRAAARGAGYTIGYRGTVGYDYVEDVARAFVRGALDCPAGATVVDLPGEIVTSEQFARAIESAVPDVAGQVLVNGPEIPSSIPPHPQPIRKVFPDWAPTNLAEGIRRSVQFYRESHAPR